MSFQVNTTNYHNQRNPDVAILNDNTFVVVWESKYQDGDDYGVYAQHFDVSGNKLGAEIQINSYTDSYQSKSEITALNDGGYVVTWRSHKQDGDNSGIYAQRYDVNSVKVGSEFSVNTETNSTQSNPSIATLVDGGFVIVWNSKYQDGDDYGIYAQQYDASSNKVNQEFLVNDATIGYQYWPDITALDNGGYVITWRSEEGEILKSDIYAKVFNSNGVAQTNEFKVNTYTEHYQSAPSIATLSNGDFIITWHSYMQTGVTNSGYEIYAQRFSESGIKIDNEFMVNTHTYYNQQESSVSALSDGGFVVAWHSSGQDGDSYGIYAQRYNADSTKNGVETQINTFTSGIQDSPSVASLADKAVIVWVSDKQDGSGYGVYAQIYDDNNIALGGANNVYDSIADVVATEDVAFELDISANFDTQLSGATLTFNAKLADGDALPIWLSINPNTGVISGTPGNDDTGLLYISAIATDSATSKQYYDSFYLTIDNVNDAPTLAGKLVGGVITGESTTTGVLKANDVDEYPYISKTTNWTDYARTEGSDGTEIYTRTNANGDIGVYTYLENNDGTKVKTWDYTLENGDWYKQVRDYDVDGDFISHYTQSNGIDYYSQASYDLNDNLTLVYSGNTMSSLGILYYDGSGTRIRNSDDIDTSYSGVSFTSNGRQLISTMDGVDEDGRANIVRYTQTDLGIDSVHREGLYYNIQNQQGTYGSLKLDEQTNWTYTFDESSIVNNGQMATDSFNLIVSDGEAETTQQIDVMIDYTPVDAIILTGVNQHLHNVALEHAKAPFTINNGELRVIENTTVETVKLTKEAYNFDITIADAIAVLRDIVDLDNLTGNAFHAADINNDGSITISDAIAVLRDIVDLETIDTFDLIDESGARITSLDANASGDAPTWTIVANGDVNMSGEFDEAYVVTSDLV